VGLSDLLNISIKETNTQAAKPELVTHNSIFADLLISDFTRRVCLFEIRNQTVKDHQLSLRYTAKPDLVNSDQSRLSPEPGRTPAARLPLVRLSQNNQHIGCCTLCNQKSCDFLQNLRPNSPAKRLRHVGSVSRLKPRRKEQRGRLETGNTRDVTPDDQFLSSP